MSSTTGTISSIGIGANLNSSNIISQLISVDSAPLTALQQQEAKINANLSAWGQLNSAFSTFTQSMSAAAQASTFQAMQGTSTNPTAVTVTADTTAQAGTHTLSVTSLAQAQTITSADIASTTTAVGTGTLKIAFGTYSGGTFSGGIYSGGTFTPNPNTAAQSITIDTAHATLAGVANAINDANAGVTASIVNDGSGNRLLITSNQSGTANSLKITATDNSGNALTGTAAGQLGQFAYDPTASAGSGQNMSQSTASQDAAFTLDGLSIVKSSNTVKDALSGVTLNLQGTGNSTVTVAPNTSAAASAVQNFVQSYNTLAQAIRTYTSYNATTKTGGLLNGDQTALNMQNALPKIINSVQPGLNGSVQSLADIGVKLQKDGTLAVDSAKLNTVLQQNYRSVAKLFTASGSTTDGQVQYSGAQSTTQPGSYAVNITQMATQGISAGNQPLAATTQITAGSNDGLTVNLDGTTASINLAPGSYTPSQLAAQIQAQINGVSAFQSAKLGVAVNLDSNGDLLVTSNSYGSTSQVQLSGTAVTNPAASTPPYTSLFGTLTETTGQDVKGTINGMAATGQGQNLTAITPAGQVNPAAGLQIQVTGGAVGNRGTVYYAQGTATQLLNYANDVTDPISGMIINQENTINARLKQIDNQITAQNQYLAAMQAQYTAQFTALDNIVGKLTNTSNFLMQQLSSMPWAVASTNASKA